MADVKVLDNVLNVIDKNTRKPEEFLSVQDNVAISFKNSVKDLYDFTKEQSQRNNNALPELVTEGFDEEQIWQQLELQNEGELEHFLYDVSKVLASSKKLIVPLTPSKPEATDIEEESVDEENKNEQAAEDRISDINTEKHLSKRNKAAKAHKKNSSIVDDKFFKLQELDEYLTKEEKKEKQGDKGSDTSDDESVDLFNDFSENEDEDTEDAKFLKYADFFDSPDSDDEGLNDSKDSTRHKSESEINDEESIPDSNEDIENSNDDQESHRSVKRVKFNLTNDSDETDSIENKGNQDNEELEVKSSLEVRQERLQKRIKDLEKNAISEKPWPLQGEVSGTSRPQNSLLEEFVEFDITTRPPPVITEQTTQKLEDIIIRRIKDKAWDDVEKKFKPVETPLEYKKKLILNQEKSKESLSQIYENEYLKQKEALNPDKQEQEEEEPELHKEIRKMMHSLFAKLDALSNFHYTPKPAKPELKIISNIPAINMEEVAPVAVSDATLLAPEEIKAKQRGDLIGKAERSDTDMKRERRKKKLRQRARQKAVENREKINALKPGIAKKYKKDKTAALVKKLTNDRNITKLDETGQKVPKSSTAFFNQLQDQVKTHIKSKTATVSKKKAKNAISAVKLKL